MLEKIDRALRARESIRATDTNALRIVDGAGDGLEGISIDDFANHWLVETKDKGFPAWLKSASQPESIYWKQLGEKESPNWIAGKKNDEPFEVRENGVRYSIDFTAGYSQGIFLDQRDNRLALRGMATGKTVLNCFAYTCAFGVCAALGGGNTLNLDLSKRYLDWGRRNYALNGIDTTDKSCHDFIYGDVFDWLKRFHKKGRTFDIILLDPPTFSRNEKGGVFTIENGFGQLVDAAAGILSPGGTLFCSTNQRSLTPFQFRPIIASGLEHPATWKWRTNPMPSDFSGEDYLKTWWLTSQ